VIVREGLVLGRNENAHIREQESSQNQEETHNHAIVDPVTILHCPKLEQLAGQLFDLCQYLVSSLKGEVKKKHHSNSWSFSCFAAHSCKQDLF
jgi:hypothetical protein